MTTSDQHYMDVALSLARRGLGTTHPNPAVGCVLVRPDLNNRIVGRGWTQPGGRPHAETQALKQAGSQAKRATAYVTLEPCNHHGQTPPCSEALIKAGIERCVIAIRDTDERVAGQGATRLRLAGIEIIQGLRAKEAHDLNKGFFKRISEGHPHFTLKTATSLDGKIATHSGQSKWITGAQSRAMGHALRARNDAILTAMGTVRADNPELTCRLPGLKDRSPIRIVLDTRLEISPDTKLVKSAKQYPLWIITGPEADSRSVKTLEALGARIFKCTISDAGQIDLNALARRLGTEGLTRILVEGGAELSAAFLKAGLIDEFVWFRAPFIIGGDGLSAIAGVSLAQLIDAARLKRIETMPIGDDIMEIYRKGDR